MDVILNDSLMNTLEEVFHFIIYSIADEDKKLNATYIISVARKLGCSIFLLPEDIIEVSVILLTWMYTCTYSSQLFCDKTSVVKECTFSTNYVCE